jgi:hypothetical protein
MPVLNPSGALESSAQIAAGFYLPPPDNVAATVAKRVISRAPSTLALPASVDRSAILMPLASPSAVPEPQAGAWMRAGVALMGARARGCTDAPGSSVSAPPSGRRAPCPSRGARCVR